MKRRHKLHFLFILLVLLFPTTVMAYSSKIIPGGGNVGIQINSDGVMIVGFYQIDKQYLGTEAGLELGDRIIEVNDTKVASIEQMVKEIDKNVKNEQVNLTFIRNGEEMTTVLSLVKDSNNVYKTGLFVKDQINGIGTITYIDPETKIYGALGHEIADKNSLIKIEIKDGKIFKSEVTGIIKSETGTPGEKTAKFYTDEIYGNIKQNEKSGIFGTYGDILPETDAIEVGQPDDVKAGKASIRTVLHSDVIEEFDINILKVDTTSDTKNILFEITDTKLLNETGGVVQGMSGSPIIQNNKIVGAVTHVIVNDSKKGYGIFITTMLEEGENERD